MDSKHFLKYTADDFLMDDQFIQFSEDEIGKLIDDMPEKAHEIRVALRIIKQIHVDLPSQSTRRRDEIWQRILQQKKKTHRLQILRYAASFLLLTSIASYFFFHQTQKEEVKFAVVASSQSTLILASGETKTLSSQNSTLKYSSQGDAVVVDGDTTVTQTVSDNAMNQLIVPFGKRSFVELSDGTKVWLNSGSKLGFPPKFNGKTREVILTGEALFSVTKDVNKPFFVKTDQFKLKVYGTRFDVQAYEQDGMSQVVLVEGKVSMMAGKTQSDKEVFLSPMQKATLQNGMDSFSIAAIPNTEYYTAWVDGYLTFGNESLQNVLKKVSRYYDVQIEMKSCDHLENIYGKLDLKDDVERVLNAISYLSKTTYTKRDNIYIFTPSILTK